METDLLQVATLAALELFRAERLLFLCLGVVIGLVVGVIPGLSGLVGLSLLLPFTFDMDPITAFAFLLGLSSVTVTSDTIPAVLFGVPGTVGSAATILDGHPMAKKGEAARAFGAAFSASIMGGVLGALLLAISIPILQPVMLQIATPELLAVCIFGLSLVAVLSGGSPARGIAACCIGVALTTLGLGSHTATPRWTFETLYLYDGLPIVPVTLGLFAVPEIVDMVIQRRNIAGNNAVRTDRWAQVSGIKDSFRHFFLVARSSGIGALLGAIPGMGASVVDWIAYAHAKGTERNAAETFGTGDVRGVIASESSNNAKEGGALVPTIAFGVPGSASMALLLGVFLIHGLVPGPDMLGENLNVTYTMVWSVALANIVGGGLCFLFANQLAKVALVPIEYLAPIVMSFIFVGAFQGSSQWGDIAVLFLFAILGFSMKRLGWPRPPLILGFVLGALLERYASLTVTRYGLDWLSRPIVIGVLLLTVLSLMFPILRGLFSKGLSRVKLKWTFQRLKFDAELVFILILLVIFSLMIITSMEWSFRTRLMPQSVAIVGIATLLLMLAHRLFFLQSGVRGETYDIADELHGMDRGLVAKRAAIFSAWSLSFIVFAQFVGFIVGLFLFMLCYVRWASRKPWREAIGFAVLSLAFNYLLFHVTLRLVWPQSLIGTLFPMLKVSRWTDIF